MLTLAPGESSVVVDETYAPNDAISTARLSSISGFAFVPGDVLIDPPNATYVGILHQTTSRTGSSGGPTTRKRNGDASRGMAIVTLRLHNAQRRGFMSDSPRSRTPRRRNASSKRTPPLAPNRTIRGEVAEWQTQPPQKRPGQLMWVRLPPSLPIPRTNSAVSAFKGESGPGRGSRRSLFARRCIAR